MENQNKKNESEQIKELILSWLKYWHYFVISFVVFGIIGAIYYKTADPVWNVSSRVSLRHDESLIEGSASKTNPLMSAMGLGRKSENIEDESKKMNSQGFIKNVVKKLELNKQYVQSEYFGFVKTNLYDSPPVALVVDPTMADTISKAIRFTLDIQEKQTKIKVKAGKKTIGKYEVTSFPFSMETVWGKFTFEKTSHYDLYDKPMKLNVVYTNYDYITQVYRKNLLVDFEKKTSDLINLSFKNKNPYFAKNVLNEVISSYDEEWDYDKQAISEKTLDFINDRLVLVKGLLLDADLQVQLFKSKYNLTNIEADVTYYFERTAMLQSQLLSSENQLKIIDIIIDFVKDEQNKYALIPFSLSTDENIAEVISKYNEELTRRNDLYKSNIQSDLAKSLDEQIVMYRQNLLISLENIKKGLILSRDNIRRAEGGFDSKIGKVPTIERDYISLKREQTLQQSVYTLLLEMREQSGLKGITVLPKLKIIDPPYVENKQVSPSLMKVGAVIFLFGMAVPLSIIYGVPVLKTLRRKQED
jgi:uncharacterized protein involved in exopolysaccharide biosynthesis